MKGKIMQKFTWQAFALIGAILSFHSTPLFSQEDFSGYAPSAIPVRYKIELGADSIRYRDALLSFGNDGDWHEGLSWNLEIGGRKLSKRFGPAFKINGNYRIPKELISRKISPNESGDGLILRAQISLDGTPCAFESELRIVDGVIHYRASSDTDKIPGGGAVIALTMLKMAFNTSHYRIDSEKKETVIKPPSTEGKTEAYVDAAIPSGKELGLYDLSGNGEITFLSDRNDLKSKFFVQEERTGEIEIILGGKDNTGVFSVQINVDGLSQPSDNVEKSVPQQVLAELKDRGKNLLRNGGFEFSNRYLASGGYQNQSWLYRNNKQLDYSIESVWSVVDDATFSGRKSLKLTCPPGFSMAQIECYAVPVNIQKEYTFSFYAKSLSQTRIEILLFGAKGNIPGQTGYQSYAAKQVVLTEEWQRYTVTFSPATYYLRLALRCDNRNEETSEFETAWFDDMQLEEGTSATEIDHDRINASFLAQGNFCVWRPGEEITVPLLCTGKTDAQVSGSIRLRSAEGKLLSQNKFDVTLDKDGRIQTELSFGKLERGVYGIDAEVECEGKIARDNYRINVMDKLPDNFRNRDLVSVSFGGGRDWTKWFESFATFGIHLARTWTWLPDEIIEKYLNNGKRTLELYGSLLADNNNFGPLIPGKKSHYTRRPFYDHVPFALTPEFESQTRESMRYYLNKYGSSTKFLWVMNEPNAPNWARYAHDGRLEGVQPEMAAEITRWAYEEKNLIHPQLELSGPATYNIDLPWIDRYLQAGAGKYIGYFDFHCYNWNPELYMDQNVERLKQLLAKHGIGNVKLICSEMGLYAPYDIPEVQQFTDHLATGRDLIDYRVSRSEAYMSSLLVRNYLLALKQGLYTCTYFSYDAKGSGNLALDRDFTPRMYVPTLNHFNHELGNMLFRDEISYDTFTRALIFSGENIDKTQSDIGKAAIWCSLKEVFLGQLPSPVIQFPPESVPGLSLEISDFLGRTIPSSPADGIPLTAPVYLAAKRDGNYLTASELYQLLNFAVLKGGHGDTIISYVAFAKDAILVEQHSRHLETGTCAIKCENNPEIDFAVKDWNGQRSFTGEFKPFDLAKLLPFQPYKFTVENRLNSGTYAKQFTKSFYVSQFKENSKPNSVAIKQKKSFLKDAWKGDDDFSANLTMTWDDAAGGHLYLDLAVRDNRFSPPPAEVSPQSFWEYDSLTLYFDTKADGYKAKSGDGLDTNDYRYDFALQEGKPVVFRAVNPEHQQCFLYPGKIDEEVKCALTMTDDGYIYHIAIPQIRLLSFNIKEGEIFRFAAFLGDNDGEGRKTGLTTTPENTDPCVSPNLWTDVLLVK
jgi:hypothetical protein